MMTRILIIGNGADDKYIGNCLRECRKCDTDLVFDFFNTNLEETSSFRSEVNQYVTVKRHRPNWIYNIPKVRGYFNQLDLCISLRDFIGVCQNENIYYDVCQIHFLNPIYAKIADRLKKISRKVVITPWGSDVLHAKKYQLRGLRKLVQKSNWVTCTQGSRFEKDIVTLLDIPKEKLYNLPIGIASIDEMKDFYLTFYPQFNLETYQHYVDLFRLPQNKPLKDYSKGMKRQAMLALALAIAPKYLLLDEAFDGLDPVMRLAFKKAINQMIDENMTVIISSHNLRELEDICDSFGILDNGCMTTSGDLYDIKDHIHKIQLAFKEELNKEEFSHLDVLSFHKQSRVINMVVKGDINEIKDYLRMFNPIMLEVLPVNLEEIFIYEMERKGYGVYD